MEPPLSKRAIDDLGDRLRASESIGDEDLRLLQALEREFDEALVVAVAVIRTRFPDLEPTSRVKTNKTLIEKLKRTPGLRLSNVRDIGGIRLVREMDRLQQDELAAQIVDLFPEAQPLDRRERPNHGYRAVHVLTRVNRCRIEIQVRTELQHLWAELVEKLGDMWGRQIRYGGGPRDPDRPYGGGSRQDFWVDVQQLAELVDRLEQREIEAAQLQLVATGQSRDEVHAVDILGQWQDLRAQVRDHLAALVVVAAAEATRYSGER